MSKHESWNLTGDQRARRDDATALHAQLAKEFDAWAEAGRADSMEQGHMPTAGQALARIDLDATRPTTFVDLGCGNGYAVRWAAERMHANGQAVGIDVAPGMVAKAEAAMARWQEERRALWSRIDASAPAAAPCRFERAAFDDLPFNDADVDHIFSNEALYYAPDVDAALSEAYRVLRPEGTIHCCIDFFQENEISHDWPEKTGLRMTMESRQGWQKRFEAAGFDDVRLVRLLDPTPIEPMTEEQAAHPDWQKNYRHLIAWKKSVGSLLIEARKPGAD